MVYMFNELSLAKVNAISEAREVLEIFVKTTISAKELGFNELRFNENTLQNLYQLSLLDGYRIDVWLKDKEVNSDLQESFRDIFASSPLIKSEDVDEVEFFERSEFYKDLEGSRHQVFGLGAAHVYGTLAISLATHEEWNRPATSIQHYSLDHLGNESNTIVDVRQFSSNATLNTHNKWIEDEQKNSFEKSSDLWNRRAEYFPNLLFGVDVENQIKKIGLTKRFNQVFDCLKKLDAFAGTWKKGGFNLNDLKAYTLMDVSGESACTMQKYPVLRKFRLADGQKAQFELHIKIPDVRIYFFPVDVTFQITVGYIGKHLKTCSFD